MPVPTFQDIKRLLDEKVAEHQGLEYKSDFPRENFKLEKSMVAFANSNEGHIIIGITSDKKTNQPISITGIKAKEGLIEKVADIAHSRPTPPVDVHTNVIDIPNTNKVVVVIRVPLSFAEPNMASDGRYYVRQGPQSIPANHSAVSRLFKMKELMRGRVFTGFHPPKPLKPEEIARFVKATTKVLKERYSHFGANIVLAEEKKAHERFRDHPIDNIPRVFAGWKYDNETKLLTITPFGSAGDFKDKSGRLGWPYLPEQLTIFKYGGSWIAAYGKEHFTYYIEANISLKPFNNSLTNLYPESFTDQLLYWGFLRPLLTRIAQKNNITLSGVRFVAQLSPGTQTRIKEITDKRIQEAIRNLLNCQEELDQYLTSFVEKLSDPLNVLRNS